MAVVLLLGLLWLGGIEGSCTDSDVLDLRADGLQWVIGEDPLISALYKEWWFFALYDEKSDIAGAFGYSVTDPEGLFGEPSSGMAAQWWPTVANNNGTDMISLVEPYPFSSFNATPDNASLTIGDLISIEVLNGDTYTYRVKGATKDGSAIWDLTFQQLIYACREVFEVPEMLQLDWISFMPSAHVTGTVTLKGRGTYTIDTVGYHDHNYGAWPSSLFNWIWSQFSSPSNQFAFVLGAYHVPVVDTYLGYIFVRYQGQRYKLGSLCDDTFQFQPLEWQTVNGLNYSIHNKVMAQSTDHKLVIEYKAKLSNDNPGGRGLDLSVFEQVSFYTVQFYEKNGEEWNLLVSTSGWGFSEWSNVVV